MGKDDVRYKGGKGRGWDVCTVVWLPVCLGADVRGLIPWIAVVCVG